MAKLRVRGVVSRYGIDDRAQFLRIPTAPASLSPLLACRAAPPVAVAAPWPSPTSARSSLQDAAIRGVRIRWSHGRVAYADHMRPPSGCHRVSGARLCLTEVSLLHGARAHILLVQTATIFWLAEVAGFKSSAMSAWKQPLASQPGTQLW